MKNRKFIIVLILLILIASTLSGCNRIVNSNVTILENSLNSNEIEITSYSNKRKILKMVDKVYNEASENFNKEESVIIKINETKYYFVENNIFKYINNESYQCPLSEKDYNYLVELIENYETEESE